MWSFFPFFVLNLVIFIYKIILIVLLTYIFLKERELKDLRNEVDALSRGELLINVPDEVERLRTQNAKLQYRIAMLKKVVRSLIIFF